MVAVAVLVADGRYALQHRDDRPDIAWPAHWGLFGGIVETGESPAEAVRRELHEELGLMVPECRLFWSSDDYRDAQGRRRHVFVFEADVTDLWGAHRVLEGQAAGLFAAEALPAPLVPLAGAMIQRHRARGAAA